ncbi:hypothetical protein [Bowmanella pacifica]|uniref:Uncharacterized protein n=1 Tax=Bowmanella pacifica TaxID=502051 RepID=A0A918DFD2_9ALTE|nr:hypothetical protein [Bowmanella pacifica]GGO63705.1 hypothetical protein GCM10010982_01360 [Bowmanella pacifica]
MRSLQAADIQLTEYHTPPHWVVYVGQYKQTLLFPSKAKVLYDFIQQSDSVPFSSRVLREQFAGTDDEFLQLIDRLLSAGLLVQSI